MFNINTYLKGEAFPTGALVCHVNEDRNKIAIITFETKEDGSPALKKPIIHNLRKIISQYEAGKFECGIYAFQEISYYLEEDIKSSEKRAHYLKKRDFLYNKIRSIVENEELLESYLYGRNIRSTLLEIARLNRCSEKHIYELMGRYFRYGSNINALLPLDYKKGSNYTTPKLISDPGTRRGRPPIFDSNQYRNCTKEDETKILEFVKHLPAKARKNFDRQQIWRSYDEEIQVIHFIPKDDPHGIPQVIGVPKSQRISKHSFFRVLEKIDYRQWIEDQKGRNTYQNDHAPKLGVERQGVRSPAQRYALDATRMNIYIRFPFDEERRLSSGRPWLYTVRDVSSHTIVGFYLSIGAPSWFGVGQALFNAFTDKVKFCARYGVPIAPEDWPCMHVCDELVVDNAKEHHFNRFKEPIYSHIGLSRILYTRVYAGRDKGGVESSHVDTSSKIVSHIPGALDNSPEKDGQHPSHHALLTYNELVAKIIYHVLEQNSAPRDADILDKNMAVAGIDTSSLAVWKYGMDRYAGGGKHKIRKVDELMWALLPAATASTTVRGIKLKGLCYTNAFAESEGWLSSNKKRPVKQISVRYSDTYVDQIWFKYDGKYHVCELSIRHQRMIGENRQDVEAEMALEQKRQIESTERLRQKCIEGRNILNQMLNDAITATAHLVVCGNRSMQRGINERLQAEAILQKVEVTREFMAIFSRTFTKSVRQANPGETLDAMIRGAHT